MKSILKATLLLTIAPIATPFIVAAGQPSYSAQNHENDPSTDIPETWLDIRDNVLYGFKSNVTIQQLYAKETLIIPEDVVAIEDASFAGFFDGHTCNVNNIVWNKKIKYIGNMAFSRCYGIGGSLDLSQCTELKHIGSEAFYACEFTDLTLPEGLEEIGSQAFQYCQLINSTLVLPTTVQKVGAMAFANCYKIPTIDWSNYKDIPNWIYKNNYIFSQLGESVKSDKTAIIDVSGNATQEEWEDVFERQNLEGFTIQILRTTDRECFKISEKGEIEGPADGIVWDDYDVLLIPNEGEPAITSIKDNAFSGANAITKRMRIKLNDGLTSIGKSAFSGCSGLYGNISFTDKFTQIGESAFSGCSNIQNVDLSKTQIQAIPKQCFKDCTNLLSTIWPKTITTLGANSFTGCHKLNSIDVSVFGPEELPPFEIEGDGASNKPFYNSSPIGTIYINSGMTDSLIIQAWVAKFESAQLDTNSSLDFNDGKYWCTYRRDNDLPFDHILFSYTNVTTLNGLEKAALPYLDSYDILKIPTQIQEIRHDAFESIFLNSQREWKLELNLGLNVIGNRAFANSNRLVGQLTLPKTLTYIGDQAFYHDCHFRNELVIPNNVTYIGSQAFDGCALLWSDNLILPDVLQTLGAFAFATTQISKITIPSSIKTISWCAFSNMSHLDSIDLSSFKSLEDFKKVQITSYSFDTLLPQGDVYVNKSTTNDEIKDWEDYLHQNGLPEGWEVHSNGGNYEI